MRLLPKSSFYRTFLLIIAVVVVTHLLTFSLTTYFVYFPAVKQLSYSVIAQVTTLTELSDESLSALGSGVALVGDELAGFDSWISSTLQLKFSLPQTPSRLGLAEARLRFVQGPHLYLQYAEIKPQWVKVPIDPFDKIKLWMVIAWAIGNPAVVILATLISVRQIAAPLKKLKNAALRVSRGDIETLHLGKRETDEVLAVNGAFNTMASSLRQATNDRALLLAGISHDLRTPLTRMRLTAELLKVDDPELVEGIVMDIQDMNAILDQFISFMRDGSDETAELGCINQLIMETKKPLENARQIVDTSLQNIPEIYFKRVAFKRMLSNLINNAFVHGGTRVEIQTQVKDQEIIVRVLDDGPGIPEEKIACLFTPFARGDESRSTSGSGLGLAIVHRIVSMHHGRIELRNRQGGGLAAVILLPMSGQLVAPDSLSKSIR